MNKHSMQKKLIIKTSSLGDIVHMLPAISDAAKKTPDISFDWVLESSFAEIPAWHPQVDNIIQSDIRRWRKSLLQKSTWVEMKQFKQELQQTRYKKIIDSQGLIKSAVLGCLSKGETWGYDKNSITESLASYCYNHTVSVPFKEHAVTRNRLLLAKSLGYSLENLSLDYGIAGNKAFSEALSHLAKEITIPERFIVALHGTSRIDKEWPIAHWDNFIKAMENAGYAVLIPWSNDAELARANKLAEQNDNVTVLPRCSLTTLAGLIETASAVIGMDTGLMHVAAAFNKKGIALYPVTQPELTGVLSTSNSIESIGGSESLNAKLINAKMLTLLKK